MTVVPDWADVIAIAEETQRALGQGTSPGARIRAVVYPCSSLQVLV